MAACGLHHVEIGVKNGLESLKKFTNILTFRLIAQREHEDYRQWAIKTGSTVFLLTELRKGKNSQAGLFHKQHGDATSLQASSQSDIFLKHHYLTDWGRYTDVTNGQVYQRPHINSVFNIALEVKEVEKVVQRIGRYGGEILRPPATVEDDFGSVTYATVKSCVGNIVHTLINSSNYNGTFLPGFLPVDDFFIDDKNNTVHSENERQLQRNRQTNISNVLTHFDHVTYACPMNVSPKVMQWYQKCFGMERFLINRDENIAEGFLVQGDNVGMRLVAMEYWKCAEAGLQMPCTDTDDPSLKIVIAEPLPGQGPNQVETFLQQHQGAGIQHIGLHTDNIFTTVELLKDRGIDFIRPPDTYYSEVGKLAEIDGVGECCDSLKKHGILLDAEADAGAIDNLQNVNRYLMQMFTKPLFAEDTFFVEVIQRCGATGFGAGNIKALWRAVQAFLDEKTEHDEHVVKQSLKS